MQDIAIYADRLGFEFEVLLERLAAADNEVREWARKQRKGGGGSNGGADAAQGDQQRSEAGG
jgi:hypothetical protein